MADLKAALKGTIPPGIWQPVSNTYWWWKNRGRHRFAGALSLRRRRSTRRIAAYRDRFAGERCFIIGNGPSLKRMDLSLLKDEHTFGLNRIYLLFPELGFTTSYLVSVNDLVIEQCAQEFKALALPRFMTWRGRRWLADDGEILFIDSDFTMPETFSEDATGRIYEGCTVTYVALQLAFYMGFSQAILIGVDHNFQTLGKPNEVVVSDGEDPNHFDPNYFGKGFVWQLPDYEGSERAYALARDTYAKHGREVLDATVGGKLTVFPKIDYESLF
jgi:hypothetical protein